MSEKPHAVRAFLLAPLIGPLVWAAALGVTWAKGPVYVLGEIGVVVVSSLPFIYGAAVLIGLPLYLLIRRRSQLAAWHSAIAGAVLGAVTLPLAEPVVGRAGFGAMLGLAAGVLFWVLWRPRPNRALNPTGLRPAG
jgi:hypothetical protein